MLLRLINIIAHKLGLTRTWKNLGIVEWKGDCQKQAEKIKGHVDHILNHLEQNKSYIDGAVNWADLQCVDVEYCLDTTGDEFYLVTVDEAAPDNPELQLAIIRQLQHVGIRNVRVLTEW